MAREKQFSEAQVLDEVADLFTSHGYQGTSLTMLLDATGLGTNVRIENVDALTWDTDRRFDVVCVTAAVATVPPRFLQWLRPGGRLFVVRGASPVMEAVLHVNDVNGPRIESLFETDLPYLVGAAPAPQFVF